MLDGAMGVSPIEIQVIADLVRLQREWQTVRSTVSGSLSGIADDADTATRKVEAGFARMSQVGRDAFARISAGNALAAGMSQAGRQASALGDEMDRSGRKGAAAFKATQQQMLQLGFQAQDLFVQISSGQSPLLALIQQGSQVQAVMGGTGNALRAITSLFTPFRLAVGGSAAVVAVLSAAFLAAESDQVALQKMLALTGNQAGLTAGSFRRMADDVAEGARISTGAARDLVQALAATGSVGADNLAEAGLAAQTMARATGQSVDEVVADFARAAESPGAYALKLQQAYGLMEPSLLAHILQLERTGERQEALRLVLQAVSTGMANAAGQTTTFGGFLDDLARSASNAWTALKDVARLISGDLTSEERVRNMASKLQTALDAQAGRSMVPTMLDPMLGLDGVDRAMDDYLAAVKTMMAEAQAAAEDAAETTRRKVLAKYEQLAADQLSIQQRIVDKTKQINAEADAARVTAAERERMLALGLADLRKQAADAEARAGEAMRRSLKDTQATLLQTVGLNAEFYEQWDRLSKLFASGALGKGDEGLNALLAAQQALLAKQPVVIKGLEEEAAARKVLEDAQKAQAQAEELRLAQGAKTLQDIEQQIAAARLEGESIGRTAAELRTLEIARLEEAEARLVQVVNARIADRAGADEIAQLQLTILRTQELIALRRQNNAKQDSAERDAAARKSATDAVAEWQRAADKIESAITDALMRGFERGEGFGRNLVDTLTRTIKAQLGNAIIGPIARTLSLAISQALRGVQLTPGSGGAGAGAAAVGGGSALETLGIVSSLKNAYATLESGVNSASASLSFFAEDVGTWLVMNTSGALNSFGGSLLEASSQIGDFAPYLGSVLSALQGDIKGAALSAVGTYIGGAFGGPLGAVIGSVAGNLLSGLMGSKDPYHAGAAYTINAAGEGMRPTDRAFFRASGLTSSKVGFEDYTKRASEDLDAATKSLAEGLFTTYRSVLDAFDQQAQSGLTLAFRANGEKASGNVIIGGTNTSFKTGENDPGKGFQAFAGAAAGAIVRELQDAGLPQWADTILEAIDDSKGIAALQEAAQSIGLILQVTETFAGGPIAGLRDITAETVIALGQLSGGIQNLQGGLQAYYAAFYSEEERATASRKRLGEQFATLADTASGQLAVGLDDLAATLMGVQGATSISRAEFRALFESIDPNAQATQALYVQMLALAPAFAELVPEVESVVDETGNLSEAASRAADILRQRNDLERQLAELTGNTAALRAMERAEIDASNLALYDRIAALRQQQQSEADMAAAADRVAGLRQAMTQRVADAQQRLTDLQRASADELRSFAGGLEDFVAGLQQLDAGAGLDALRGQFADTLAAAQAGDTGARERLQTVAGTLLEAERAQAGSTLAFQAAQAKVAQQLADLAAAARTQADAQAAPEQTLAQQIAAAQQALLDEQAAQAAADRQILAAGLDLQTAQLTETQQLAAALGDYAAAAGRATQAALAMAAGVPLDSIPLLAPPAAAAAAPAAPAVQVPAAAMQPAPMAAAVAPAHLSLPDGLLQALQAKAQAAGLADDPAQLAGQAADGGWAGALRALRQLAEQPGAQQPAATPPPADAAAARGDSVAQLKQLVAQLVAAAQAQAQDITDIRNAIARDALDGDALRVRTVT